MSVKYFNFMALAWFFSTVICLILEGSQLGATQNRVINDLILFTTIKVGGIVPIPVFNLYFFRGLFRLLTFDYSFYQGGFIYLRAFWVLALTPGVVWAIGQAFASVFAQFLRVLR